MSHTMPIEIHGATHDVTFDVRLILAVMTTRMVPPTPIAEEMMHDDRRIVQQAFDKLAARLSNPVPTLLPVDGKADDGAPNIMDQDPDALRATARKIETLLQEIGIVTDTIEPYCDEGVSIDDVRKIAADQILPIERNGRLKLYGISGVNWAGERRALVCSGNSPRALPIARAAQMGFYVLPLFVTLLRDQADRNEEMRRAAAPDPPRINLYREIRMTGVGSDDVRCHVEPCAPKAIVFMAKVLIPYETPEQAYDIICYLMDMPASASTVGPAIVLHHHVEQIFLEGATL